MILFYTDNVWSLNSVYVDWQCRLQGITKFITRFPTYKRRFDVLVKTLSEELADKYGNSTIIRSKSAFPRIFSLKSFKVNKTVGSDQESELGWVSETSF